MRTWLGIAVALVIGLGLGMLLSGDDRGRLEGSEGPVLAAPGLAAPGPARADSDNAWRETHERTLAELQLEIRSLRSELLAFLDGAAGAESDASTRMVSVSEDESVPSSTFHSKIDPELREWMERIDLRIERLAKAPGSLPLIQLPPAGVRPQPLPLPTLLDENQEAFAVSHLLWTYQDVVNAYGRPDVVHDGSEWEYKFAEGRGTELGDIHFQFNGGMVVHMYAH